MIGRKVDFEGPGLSPSFGPRPEPKEKTHQETFRAYSFVPKMMFRRELKYGTWRDEVVYIHIKEFISIPRNYNIVGLDLQEIMGIQNRI